MNNEEIIKDLAVICKCKVVRRRRIRMAISEGASTIDDLRRMTGANTGCGQRCTESLKRLLAEFATAIV